MSLSYAIKGAATSHRIKEYMRRTGRTPWGDIMWTKEEEAVLKSLHPNYKAIKRALRRRTMPAIRARAGKLGLTKKIHVWTGAELMRLRRLYTSNAPRAEILAALPGITWGQIDNCAQYHRLHRTRKPFKKTGHEAIDIILQWAFEDNLSLVDIDKISKTKNYFSNAKWCGKKYINDKAVSRAARALGGNMLPVRPESESQFQRRAA